MRFAIAPNGIFHSIQGEGFYAGHAMRFLRLAGCSVGCAGCDTDYSVGEKLSLDEIVERLEALPPTPHLWITGGEPTDLGDRLGILVDRVWRRYTHVATSGVRRLEIPGVLWSVSPHGGTLERASGFEIKLVDGLNGLRLEDYTLWHGGFDHAYVQPKSFYDALDFEWEPDPRSLAHCLQFVRDHPEWAISEQRHHAWGVL